MSGVWETKYLHGFDGESMFLVKGDLPDDKAIRAVVDNECPCDAPETFLVVRRGWWRAVPCGHVDDVHTIHYEPTSTQTRGGFQAVHVGYASAHPAVSR